VSRAAGVDPEFIQEVNRIVSANLAIDGPRNETRHSKPERFTAFHSLPCNLFTRQLKQFSLSLSLSLLLLFFFLFHRTIRRQSMANARRHLRVRPRDAYVNRINFRASYKTNVRVAEDRRSPQGDKNALFRLHVKFGKRGDSGFALRNCPSDSRHAGSPKSALRFKQVKETLLSQSRA